MSEYIYSIVIPHKNTPDLLKRCLNSIPHRDDIQIIIVDDNSDAEKVDFEHFPGIEKKNVEIYLTKEGKGAGYVRNVGLKYAKGKWLLFADADDYYNDGFTNTLDKYAYSSYDIIYFKVSSNTLGQYDRSLRINQAIDQYQDKNITLDELKYLHWQPWNKMIARDFIKKHNIWFDEIPIGNDAFFSLKAAEKTNNIHVIDDKIYCNTFNQESITYRKSCFQRELKLLDINIRINKFLRAHGLAKYQMRLIGKTLFILKNYKGKEFISYIKYINQKDSFANIIKHNIFKLLHIY